MSKAKKKPTAVATMQEPAKPDNPFAFATALVRESGFVQYGMTMRDWFAGQALSGLIGLASDADDKGIAHDAYLYADAMLAERQNKRTPQA